MYKHTSSRVATALACTTFLLPTVTALAGDDQQASFQGLGYPPSAVAWYPQALSGNGEVVIFNATDLTSWRWSNEEWLQISAEPGVGYAASFDGSVIVGSLYTSDGSAVGCRWIGNEDPETFAGTVAALDVSANGNSIALTIPFTDAYFHTARWHDGTFADINPGSSHNIVPTAISPDGGTIVGQAFYEYEDEKGYHGVVYHYIWRSAGGFTAFPQSQVFSFTDVSENGEYVIGFDADAGFRFSQSGGFVSIAPLPGGITPEPLAVSADGQVVVGWCVGAGAFIWDPMRGTRDLAVVLEQDYGLTELANWGYLDARCISADGLTIAGYGTHYVPGGMQFEAWIARLPRVDTDDDGLWDDWETLGVPYIDTNGDWQHYMLPGANPLKKDLYVEIDRMENIVAPVDLQPAIDAFAAAPVTNPDGTTGIVLHLDLDETDLKYVPQIDYSGAWPEEADVLRNVYFGHLNEHNEPGLLAARAKAFRYCLYVDTLSTNVLGLARDFWANDFLICKGRFTTGPGGLCVPCTADEIALYEVGTFMHELGHCLNLRHGGNDDTYYKVNYLSVMNPWRQVPFKLSMEQWRVDYSHGTMESIQEDAINEMPGAGGTLWDVTGHNDGAVAYYGGVACEEPDPCRLALDVPSVPYHAYEIGAADRDFNDDDQITGGVCLDLDYFGSTCPIESLDDPSPCEQWSDHDDWGNLVYQLRPPDAVAGPTGPPPACLTTTEVQYFLTVLPDLRCHADFNRDQTVDVADLLALIVAWGACDGSCPAEPCLGDLSADCQVDVSDVVALIVAWGSCP